MRKVLSVLVLVIMGSLILKSEFNEVNFNNELKELVITEVMKTKFNFEEDNNINISRKYSDDVGLPEWGALF